MKISSVEDYKAFVKEVNENNKTNTNAILMTDLDFEGVADIQPIGTNLYSKPYMGTFDGQGHTIRNLTISLEDGDVGMFRYVKDNAVIKNLIIDESCVFKGNSNVGFIAQSLYSNENSFPIISNILCKATVTTYDSSDNSHANLGGIIASAGNLTISDCAFVGEITAHTNLQGSMCGIAANISNNVTIQNCVVNADLNIYYEIKEYSHWDPEKQENVYITKQIHVIPDPYLFKSDNNNDKSISNIFSNVIGNNDFKVDGKSVAVKINKNDDGQNPAYYILKSELSESDESWPDMIDTNSQIFAEILGSDEWLYDEEKGLVPFVKTIEEQKPVGGDTEDPDSPALSDDVKKLGDLLTKIYGNNEVPDGIRLSPYQYKSPKEYAGSPTYDNEGNIQQRNYTTNSNNSDYYKAGTVATFFYPRPTDVDGIKLSMPEDASSSDPSDSDFIIAADISTAFANHKEHNVTDNKIYEPTVLFRHIFRIKDGKSFAEEFSGSPENNRRYVEKHRKIMSASSTGVVD